MNPWGYLDTRGAWDGAAAMPEQLAAAFEAAGQITAASRFAAPAPTRAVVAFAQGTGALACEAAAALTASELAVPFVVVRDATAPRFVDDHTLAFAVSLPGEGADASAAATEAATRGAHVVTIAPPPHATASSTLTTLTTLTTPTAPTDSTRALSCWLGEVSTPRAALAAVTASVLAVLARCDLIADPASSIDAAAGALAARRDAWMTEGAAPEVLARRLGRTIPLVYGAEGPMAVAARWWKAGVNRNTKAPAFAASVPAVHHDELAGWGQSGDVTRQTMSLVLLRQPNESASIDAHFASVREATDEIMANVFEVIASGADDLARFFDLSLFGELVSLHLAGREGVDPGPAPFVEENPPVGADRAG